MRPWEALVIGMIGGCISMVGVWLFNKLKIDDPVGAVTVHGLCGLWVRLKQVCLAMEQSRKMDIFKT